MEIDMNPERTKLSAAREADYRTYRDYDAAERERRQAERDRWQARHAKMTVRAQVWGNK